MGHPHFRTEIIDGDWQTGGLGRAFTRPSNGIEVLGLVKNSTQPTASNGSLRRLVGVVLHLDVDEVLDK
jgi:hypothetical protein